MYFDHNPDEYLLKWLWRLLDHHFHQQLNGHQWLLSQIRHFYQIPSSNVLQLQPCYHLNIRNYFLVFSMPFYLKWFHHRGNFLFWVLLSMAKNEASHLDHQRFCLDQSISVFDLNHPQLQRDKSNRLEWWNWNIDWNTKPQTKLIRSIIEIKTGWLTLGGRVLIWLLLVRWLAVLAL